jgi:hypothetical protein
MTSRHITVCPDPADGALKQTLANVDEVRPVAGLPGLRGLLEELGGAPGRTLDLVAHADGPTGLVRLGDSPIDMGRRDVEAFFQELGSRGLLERLGIVEVRLLGCRTASTGAGRETLRALAAVLGVRVSGTLMSLRARHFDWDGFRTRYEKTLLAYAA